nr:hypothetical protein GCM10020093_016760 [Planobispora longispora]
MVLLSSQGVATRPDSASHGVVARSIEDAVRQSGMHWTILRPGGFDSNTYAWAESVRTARTVAAPFGDVGLPTIDPDDIAEVAAAALREDGHAGQVYELTGPALITPRQQAEAIGDAIGEPIRFVEQTRDEARAQMSRFMPGPVVETTLSILGEPTPPNGASAPTSNASSGASPVPSRPGPGATRPPSADPSRPAVEIPPAPLSIPAEAVRHTGTDRRESS